MGMCGQYVAMSDTEIKAMIAGEVAKDRLYSADNFKLDIDKTWEAIHFVLCGEEFDGAPPLGYVVPLLLDRNVDFGDYGAFYILSSEVAEAYESIKEWDEKQLRQHYNFAQMVEQQIYPIVEDEDENELFEYIWFHFASIQKYLEEVVSQGKGIIFFVI